MSCFLLFVIAGWPVQAEDLPSYEVGSGASYELMISGQKNRLEIAIVESTKQRVGVEFYMGSTGLLSTRLWQRFALEKNKGRALKIAEGHVLFAAGKSPERLPVEYLRGYNDGAQMQDFLLPNGRELEKFKVKKEKVKLSVGEVEATHYRRMSNGQTIDFWISPAAGALGLVKLSSTGPEIKHNYAIEISGLLKNVGAKIDPRKAIPLTDKGRSLLPKPGSSLLMP